MSSMKENTALVVTKIKQLELKPWPYPSPPGRGEVILRSHTVGICGSDVHIWYDGRIGTYHWKEPIIPGHETSAVVVECGPGVTHIKPGDRVVVEPGYGCRFCKQCRTGRYNLCEDERFLGTPPSDGSLSTYWKFYADFCYKMPENMTMEQGALVEPACVGVQVAKKAGITAGHKVLICGSGPIGIVNMLTSKAFGADRVCITDINESRLKFAKSLGADHTIQVQPGANMSEIEKEIIESLGGRPDVTIECSGNEASIGMAIRVTQTGGTLMMVGYPHDMIRVPLLEAMVREIDIKSIFRYSNCYEAALSLMANGKIDLTPLITHKYKFKDSLEAFETARTGKDGAIKVMIQLE